MAKVATPLAFIFGAGLGAGVTYFVLKKKFEQKTIEENARVANEFNEVRKIFEEEKERLEAEINDRELKIFKYERDGYITQNDNFGVDEEPKEEVKETAKPKRKVSKAVEDLENKPSPEEVLSAGKVDYTQYSKKNTEKKADPDIQTGKKAAAGKTPFIIDKKQFLATDEFEKSYVLYFPNDNLLLGEDGDIIKNGTNLIGKSNINFLTNNPDAGTIYIRNENVMVDYAVNVETCAYEDYCEERDDVNDEDLKMEWDDPDEEEG